LSQDLGETPSFTAQGGSLWVRIRIGVLDEDAATQWTSAMTGFVRAIELRNEPHVDAVMVEDMVADVEPHDGVPSWLWGVCGFADVALGVAGLEVIGSFGVDLKGGRGYVLRGHRGSWCV
jgi:hypothetical protein